MSGNYSISGFYTGKGQAFQTDRNDTEQIAKNNALNDLAKNIKVKVTGVEEINIRQTGRGEASRVNQTVTYNTKTIVDLDLQDAQTVATWKDSRDCSVWVLVKISRECVDAILKLNKTEALYQSSRESGLPLYKRLEQIDFAIELFHHINFSALPDTYGEQTLYLTRYQTLKNSLSEIARQHRLLYITTISENLPETLHSFLISKFSDGKAMDGCDNSSNCCSNKPECIVIAKNQKAEWLVFIAANAEIIPGDFGIWEGNIHITAELIDVATGKSISTHTGNKKTFSFGNDGFDKLSTWEKPVSTLFSDGIFSELLESIQNTTNDRN